VYYREQQWPVVLWAFPGGPAGMKDVCAVGTNRQGPDVLEKHPKIIKHHPDIIQKS
jgi:hypothetical protein